MAEVTARDVTQLLAAWRAGDGAALERLLPAVYDDMRRIARHRLGQERADHTLQATALVNECYLRLLGQHAVSWQDRAHFLAVASRSMRRILVDHARRKRAAKRGGPEVTLALDEALDAAESRSLDLVALDDALEALAGLAPRQAQIIELRFFAGLTVAETAEVLDISPATVKLDFQMARAWLFGQLQR